MGLHPSFGESFYSGSSTALNVPAFLPVAIAGHSYLVDLEGYARETVDALRSGYDSLAEPGEHSLNTVGIWRRSQTHWELGCGQTHFDEKDSSEFRFHASKGIDPWTERTIRLLPETDQRLDGGSSFGQLLAIGNLALYHASESSLEFAVDEAAETWTDAGIGSGELDGATIGSITTDGTAIYMAIGTSGIWRSYITDTSSELFSDYEAQFVGFANGHLIAFHNGSPAQLVEVLADGSTVTLWEPFDEYFQVTAITPAPSGVFVAGNGYYGEGQFYWVGFNASTGALATPIPAGALPRGESINAMTFYQGRLLLGTSKGFREAEIVQDRGVSIGPVITAPGSVECLAVDGEFVWFGWSGFDATASGLGRARLSRETEALVPAYCSDLMVESNPFRVISCASFNGRRYLDILDAGVHGATDSLVEEGYIDSGLVRWGTMEKKVASTASVSHDPLHGTVRVTLTSDNGSSFNAGISDEAGTTEPRSELSGGNLRSEALEVRLTLARDGGDDTLGPVVRRWSVRSQVVPLLTDSIVVPLILKTRVKNLVGEGQDVRYDPLSEFLFLKGLEAARTPVVYQEGDLSQTVVVDKVQVKPEDWISPSHRWFEGTVFVRLLTVQSVAGS